LMRAQEEEVLAKFNLKREWFYAIQMWFCNHFRKAKCWQKHTA
jgi:hypothetical protein